MGHLASVEGFLGFPSVREQWVKGKCCFAGLRDCLQIRGKGVEKLFRAYFGRAEGSGIWILCCVLVLLLSSCFPVCFHVSNTWGKESVRCPRGGETVCRNVQGLE